MRRYRNRSTGKYYAFITTAMDCTPGHNNAVVAVYSPEDNKHQIYTMELDEFHHKYEEAKA